MQSDVCHDWSALGGEFELESFTVEIRDFIKWVFSYHIALKIAIAWKNKNVLSMNKVMLVSHSYDVNALILYV